MSRNGPTTLAGFKEQGRQIKRDVRRVQKDFEPKIQARKIQKASKATRLTRTRVQIVAVIETDFGQHLQNIVESRIQPRSEDDWAKSGPTTPLSPDQWLCLLQLERLAQASKGEKDEKRPEMAGHVLIAALFLRLSEDRKANMRPEAGGHRFLTASDVEKATHYFNSYKATHGGTPIEDTSYDLKLGMYTPPDTRRLGNALALRLEQGSAFTVESLTRKLFGDEEKKEVLKRTLMPDPSVRKPRRKFA